MKQKRKMPRGIILLVIIGVVFTTGSFAGMMITAPYVTKHDGLTSEEKHKSDVSKDLEEPNGILNLDESMKTGFLSTQNYEISFDYMEYPVATSDGSEKYHKVYTIYVRRYPALDVQIMHTVDSWDEAVEFLESRRG